jgi:hypothetical protein
MIKNRPYLMTENRPYIYIYNEKDLIAAER